MKTLTLLRHAKSSWDDPVDRDFDRPLNKRGRRAAVTIGQHLHSLGLTFERVIASSAVRVKETILGVEEGYLEALEPHYDQRIYLASADSLLELVQETPDSTDSLLMIGHNPGLEDLVFLLVPDRDGDIERDKVEEKYPTAAVVEIAFHVDSWADIRPGAGQLIRFIRPRDLDPALGPDQLS